MKAIKALTILALGAAPLFMSDSAVAGACQGISYSWTQQTTICNTHISNWWGETLGPKLNVYLWAGGGNSSASAWGVTSTGQLLPFCFATDNTPSNGFGGVAQGAGCNGGAGYLYQIFFNG
jgi:hypothetical protein